MEPSYKVLSGTKWKYVLTDDYFYYSKDHNLGYWEAKSTLSGKTFVKAVGNSIFISKDYAWDGATFAPTFKRVLPASLVHDALIQCWHDGLEIDRKTIDEIFLEMMKGNNFSLRYLYYFGVRFYDWFFSKRRYPHSVNIISTNK